MGSEDPSEGHSVKGCSTCHLSSTARFFFGFSQEQPRRDSLSTSDPLHVPVTVISPPMAWRWLLNTLMGVGRAVVLGQGVLFNSLSRECFHPLPLWRPRCQAGPTKLPHVGCRGGAMRFSVLGDCSDLCSLNLRVSGRDGEEVSTRQGLEPSPGLSSKR